MTGDQGSFQRVKEKPEGLANLPEEKPGEGTRPPGRMGKRRGGMHTALYSLEGTPWHRFLARAFPQTLESGKEIISRKKKKRERKKKPKPSVMTWPAPEHTAGIQVRCVVGRAGPLAPSHPDPGGRLCEKNAPFFSPGPCGHRLRGQDLGVGFL